MTEEVESLRGLVQEFAEFARMPQLALTPYNLNTIVFDTAKLYSERKLDLNLQESLPNLKLDHEGMRRVLLNLAENAFDAGGEDSRILIETQLEGRRADRERIFEPYISNKQEGTGLGLAMVRSIVEEHGGKITVSDSPSGGARFDIELPTPEGFSEGQEE